MPKSLFLIFAFVCSAIFAVAQPKYKITVKLNNYTEQKAFLAYHYADKQYIKDTAVINKEGNFVFENSKEPLKAGMYLLIMQPKNEYFQLLISDKEQFFSVEANAKEPYKGIKIKNSEENTLFYDYMTFLAPMRPLGDTLSKQIAKAGENKALKAKLQAELQGIGEKVKAYQTDLVTKHPTSLAAIIIKGTWEIDIPTTPAFVGDSKEAQMKRYLYYKQHYFDNIDLADPRMIRSPMLHQRVDYYIKNLTPQHPDSISKSIDYILEKVRPSEETFQFYTVHFLNEYAKSNIVGMDGVYVHLVDKYYATGQTPWVKDENLTKIITEARMLKPILIGKKAPNITVFKRDGAPISLYDVKAKYTILFIWQPDCGHCKESLPKMAAFYEKWHPKGVEIFAICDKFNDEVQKCWDFLDKENLNKWINTIDPLLKSRYKQLYYVQTTPGVFILDENKEIVLKKIAAEKFDEMMDEIIKMKGEQ
jgi:thiol-disulfide isomerase/thioredoxin